MRRRILVILLLTVVVGAAHWWLLNDLPWGQTTAKAPTTDTAPVFDTRSIAPPPPPPPPPPPKPAPAPKPRPPAPAPQPAPPPAPEPVPEPVAAPEPTPDAMPEPAGNNAAAGAAPVPAEAAPSTTPAPADDEDDEDSASSPPGNANAPPQGISLRAAPGQPRQTDLAYQAPPAQQLVFQVQGQVKGFSYSASARLRWQPQGPSYQASQEISAFLLGTRSQASRGQITASGLQPDRFEDRARKKLRAASMDWVAGLARFEPEAPLARIAPGTQDRLSVFLQLAGLLAAAPQRYPAGAEITLPTASTKAVEPWTFQMHGAEPLELPGGALDTLRLERLPRNGRDQKAELWLAPALGYLPVRIRLSESNGDYADLRLQSHSSP
ncbi:MULTISPECIES: DUF3108 domain-containing protein [Comamonas]|uniref:DUF3108 domain-containing protein n=2 Tax=Comamonas terrigena TaxID=32013 RepID=A0A2A7UPY3_COMTR|nr:MULTISPECIES: DUF3108 domain-containing protein [Comamonas]MBD9533637.1 DUF3108 domain-containing protein [Comamonas sp. CMM01]PEH87375.1 DUF3108 domain-containing protein [Comamonas terrigena]BBL26344.1 hypothetical protein CT3_37990 [Comamonas terrigena NBRC 13299]SUY70087.1 Protein of uncharacterised function (DUF3108) [Comamonas terrigena]